jgi:ribosomal protein L18
VRLTVHRSNAHIYAQVIDASGSKVLAAASTAEKELRGSLKYGGNVKAAAEIGKRIAERAKASPKWRSTARATNSTAASKRWPKRPAKRV